VAATIQICQPPPYKSLIPYSLCTDGCLPPRTETFQGMLGTSFGPFPLALFYEHMVRSRSSASFLLAPGRATNYILYLATH